MHNRARSKISNFQIEKSQLKLSPRRDDNLSWSHFRKRFPLSKAFQREFYELSGGEACALYAPFLRSQPIQKLHQGGVVAPTLPPSLLWTQLDELSPKTFRCQLEISLGRA